MFVAGGDELEDQIRGVLIEWNIANLIHDQQRVAPQSNELGGEFASGVGLLEAGNPPRRSVEQHPVAGLRGLHSQADGEVCFPCSGWAKEDNVLALGQEHSGAQMGDEVPVGAGLVVEVEILQRLVPGEPGSFDPKRCPRCFPFGYFT